MSKKVDKMVGAPDPGEETAPKKKKKKEEEEEKKEIVPWTLLVIFALLIQFRFDDFKGCVRVRIVFAAVAEMFADIIEALPAGDGTLAIFENMKLPHIWDTTMEPAGPLGGSFLFYQGWPSVFSRCVTVCVRMRRWCSMTFAEVSPTATGSMSMLMRPPRSCRIEVIPVAGCRRAAARRAKHVEVSLAVPRV